MNKLITNQTVYYSLKQESITDFPSQELTTELNLKQTDQVRQQLINKVAVKASYMHKSQLTDDIIEEIMETHKIIGVEPHQKYLIVEIENTTNDKTFPVKIDVPIYYNPITEAILIATYNVEDASNPTLLYFYYAEEGQEEYWTRGVDVFSKVEIDGTEVSIQDLDTAQGQYQLSNGEHTVKYTLKDPTMIGIEFDKETSMPTKFGAIFYNCTGLTSVIIPNSVTSIGNGAFNQCNSLISVTIPNSVINIGNSAFNECSSLTNVTIPDNVTSISERAFYDCSNLTNITIGNSVTSIGDYAFQLCTGLTNITIPNSVTIIEPFAFNKCSSLTSVTIEATTPPTLRGGAFDNTNNCPIYVPSASIKTYKAAWTVYADRIFKTYEYVDLGLPSGTLWATMNVGATSETDYGNYYMYGMGIKTYDSTDTPYAGTENPLATSVDTAAQVWGGDWHMPTRAQMQELIDNTTYEWITDYNGSGINGGLFTAQNGNSIFLPAAGHWYDDSQNDVGDDGSYWGSSPDGSDYACYLDFYDGGKDVDIYGRRLGYSVRPVIG